MANSASNSCPASVERILKTGYLIRQRGYIGRRNQTIVPKIDLSGKWLKEAGFAVGQSVTVQEGHLIITPTLKGEGHTVTGH